MTDYDDGPTIIIERRGSITAFLWGGLIGAGVALLFAPRSGEETREELRQGANRLRGQAEDAVRNVQTAVSDTMDGVRAEVTGRVDQARDAFDAGRRAALDSRERLERRVDDARDRVRVGVDAARAHPASTTAAPERPMEDQGTGV